MSIYQTENVASRSMKKWNKYMLEIILKIDKRPGWSNPLLLAHQPHQGLWDFGALWLGGSQGAKILADSSASKTSLRYMAFTPPRWCYSCMSFEEEVLGQTKESLERSIDSPPPPDALKEVPRLLPPLPKLGLMVEKRWMDKLSGLLSGNCPSWAPALFGKLYETRTS